MPGEIMKTKIKGIWVVFSNATSQVKVVKKLVTSKNFKIQYDGKWKQTKSNQI